MCMGCCTQWGDVLQVGPEEHVICALSGGVDSTVAATLVHKVGTGPIDSLQACGCRGCRDCHGCTAVWPVAAPSA